MSSIRMTRPIPRGQSDKICKPKKILYCNYKFLLHQNKSCCGRWTVLDLFES